MFTNKNPTDADYERWGYFDDEEYDPTDEELDATERDLIEFDDYNYDAGYLDEQPWYLGREY